MAVVTFDYGALQNVSDMAKSVAKGGFWGSGVSLDSYADGLKSKIYNNLSEWKLPKSNPYGNTYVSTAQNYITSKNNALQSAEDAWVAVSGKVENYLEYVKEKDEEVGEIFAAVSDLYEDYNGFSGFVNWVKDGLYGLIGVDFLNSNVITRKIGELGKFAYGYLDRAKTEVKEWFQYGNGRYVANIAGSILLTGAAIIGTVVSIVGIPFTGGSSAVVTVSCIGAIAGGISAIISTVNTCYTVQENIKAMNAYKDDPGKARFYGEVEGYSDYVKKNDLGNAEENAKAASRAETMDNIQKVADAVDFVTGAALTFGTKTIDVKLENGDMGKKKVFTKSPSDIKKNVLKTFGFEVVDKKPNDVPEIEMKDGALGIEDNQIGKMGVEYTESRTATEIFDSADTTAFKQSSADINADMTITKGNIDLDYVDYKKSGEITLDADSIEFKATRTGNEMDANFTKDKTQISFANKQQGASVKLGDDWSHASAFEKDSKTVFSTEKTSISFGEDKVTYNKRQVDFNIGSKRTEYTSIATMDGGRITAYTGTQKQYSGTIDFTKVFMSSDKVSEIEALDDLKSCTDPKKLKYLQWKGKVEDVTDGMEKVAEWLGDATEDEKGGVEKFADKAKENYFISQVDKYVYSLPTGDDVKPIDYLKGIGGSGGDKVWEGGKAVLQEGYKGWQLLIGSLA